MAGLVASGRDGVVVQDDQLRDAIVLDREIIGEDERVRQVRLVHEAEQNRPDHALRATVLLIDIGDGRRRSRDGGGRAAIEQREKTGGAAHGMLRNERRY